MKSLLTVTLITLPSLALAAPIQLLENPQGIYSSTDVPDVKNDQLWTAIIRTPTGSKAQQITLKVENVEDPTDDPANNPNYVPTPGEKRALNGRNIITNLKPTPIFLLRGLSLKDGNLPTALTSPTQLTSDPLTLTTSSTTIVLQTLSDGRAIDQYNTGYAKNYRLIATINGHPTTLIPPFNFYEGHETLLWAGDLNGDHIPDLVLDSGGENTSTINLFLSTPTKIGPTYRKVAERTTTGC